MKWTKIRLVTGVMLLLFITDRVVRARLHLHWEMNQWLVLAIAVVGAVLLAYSGLPRRSSEAGLDKTA